MQGIQYLISKRVLVLSEGHTGLAADRQEPLLNYDGKTSNLLATWNEKYDRLSKDLIPADMDENTKNSKHSTQSKEN